MHGNNHQFDKTDTCFQISTFWNNIFNTEFVSKIFHYVRFHGHWMHRAEKDGDWYIYP